MSGPHAVLVGRGSLFVGTNDRIMVFTPVPTQTGAPGITASAVLGAPDLMTPAAVEISATTLGPVYGMELVDDKLFVADSERHRVLRFSLRY
jgi:hypothetical protein